MKYMLCLTIVLCSIGVVKGQKLHEISILAKKVHLQFGGFHIDSVRDYRKNKDDIGFVQKGFFNRPVRAEFDGGLLFTFNSYFNYVVSKSKEEVPITIQVKEFTISEETKFSVEYAIVQLTFEYYSGTKLLYSSRLRDSARGLDVTKEHPSNIVNALSRSLRHFDRSPWREKLLENQKSSSNIDSTHSVAIKNTKPRVYPDIVYKEPSTAKNENRNAFAIGYQIGGLTLIGVDYEVRVANNFGVHFGGGFAGYTAGLKVHTNQRKNSPFFNLNYKDGGFGLLETAGLEYGGRIPFRKNGNFGLQLQLGFGRVLHADKEILERVFKSDKAPKYTFTIGAGLGW